MQIIEILFISISLAMDAFAVSICKGLSMFKMNWKKAIIIGLYFGGFQSIMPLIGYLIGSSFNQFVSNIDHWVSFILLSFIGLSMIIEAFNEDNSVNNNSIDIKTMLILSVATSIDALAVGITFAFLNANIVFSFALIGIITFILSILGVEIGNRFGDKHHSKAQIIGGAILILIGLKILLEHLSILQFT